ncbi:MAG: NAD-dependent epimerase/dehydratase family protein [Lutibacter sp.]|nr:NAD-dependent epimerase/dehydratase family protein [Lutibacter sp.]
MELALLTGSNGFLGKYIQKCLKNHYHVSTLSRKTGNYQIYLEQQVPTFVEEFNFVVHAAGKAHCIPKTESEKQEFYLTNIIGTQNLLEGLSKTSVPKYFVFISSVSVYGQEFGSNIDENNDLAAVDPYGISKVAAEQLVSDWCNSNNVVCSILRLPLIVGSNPPGNLGALIKGLQKGYYFNIAGGKARKSMVLAEDVANSIINIAKIGGIYNLTDGYHPSLAELSEYISVKLGKGKPMFMPMWLARIIANFGDLLGSNAPLNTNKLKKITSDLTFDDSKAREVFGWNPKPVLDGFNIK